MLMNVNIYTLIDVVQNIYIYKRLDKRRRALAGPDTDTYITLGVRRGGG